jgi:hypothetical protein
MPSEQLKLGNADPLHNYGVPKDNINVGSQIAVNTPFNAIPNAA